jgi:hypothetical protein
VRGAISNYQSDLLSQVKSDIKHLYERITYEKKHNHSLSTARDFPDISNRVIWIDQLSRRLDGYEQKVKDVLGDDWKRQTDATEIDEEVKKVGRMLNHHQKFYLDELTKILQKL